MAKKIPLRIYEPATATGATYDYVKSDQVPPGEIWCIQGYSYENQTGARGTFRRGRMIQDEFRPDAEYTTPGAGELVFGNKELFLVEGEQLAVRQASCTANDVLVLIAHGYIIKSRYIDDREPPF